MTEQIYNHLTAGMDIKKRHIIIGNFLGGLAWGVGSVLGATIVIAILVAVLKTVNFVPVIGNFAAGIVDQVEVKREQIQKE